jgi:hypothetical protein
MTTINALNNDAGPGNTAVSVVPLDCSSSGDGDCNTMDVVNVTDWNDDSLYPADYIAQRNAWIAAMGAEGGPHTTPFEPPNDTVYGDTSLECNSDKGYQTGTGSVNVATVTAAMENACTWWMGNKTTLNSQDYLLIEAFPISGSNNWLWLEALWNRGEPLCANSSREVITFERGAMLSTVLNSCNTSTTALKNGGTKTFDCIVWEMGITDATP